MSERKDVSSQELYYSILYGRGLYHWNNEVDVDPFEVRSEKQTVCPILTNMITGEKFLAKKASGDAFRALLYCHAILHPPVQSNIYWPVDVVNLSKDKSVICSSFIEQEYKEKPTSEEDRRADYLLLFPYREYSGLIDAERFLSRVGEISWKNEKVRNIAVGIVDVIDTLNRCGYVYNDIHLSRFFVGSQGEVYLDFSNLIFPMHDFSKIGLFEKERYEYPGKGDYPIEFAEPAYVSGKVKSLDFHSQNYSLCALLFYLFTGRYAYDGRLLTGQADDSLQSHYIKFREYHKMPIFIFDPEDTQNSLGAFEDEQQVIMLWEELPKQLRELFVYTLRKDNAERSCEGWNPVTGTWLRCFREIGWID